jgi:hypothetical protein
MMGRIAQFYPLNPSRTSLAMGASLAGHSVLTSPGAITDAKVGVEYRTTAGPDGGLLIQLRPDESQATDIYRITPEGKLDPVYPNAIFRVDWPGEFNYCMA